ncbi:sugar ABC transporter permease [Aestuariivirga sp.]|uniref:sugar ABC transporter permease n=1 Tax=Aestuariivirga sp. TaxID=2650926 RepID=UPI0030159DA1
MNFLAVKFRSVSDRIARAAGLDVRLLGMLFMMAVIWLTLDVLTGGLFITPRNIFNLSLQVSVVGIMTCGMVLVIVSRHIDLSVGSQIGFIGVFGALMQNAWLPIDGTSTWWITSLAMLGAGIFIGFAQGLLVAYAGIPSFVVTLGGLLFLRNAAFYINSGVTVAPLNETFQLLGGGLDGTIGVFWSWVVCGLAIAGVALIVWRSRRRRSVHSMAQKPLASDVLMVAIWAIVIAVFTATMNGYKQPKTDIGMGIPIPVLILIGVTIVMSAVARKHRFGRHVFAMGGSSESAELAGIDTRRLTLLVFMMMGLLCGLGSIVTTARLNAGASVTGTMTELTVIAAAVIGGTSLAGGIGTVYGGIVGAVIMQSLESGMILMGVPTPLQRMVLALVLIIAVWVDTVYRKARRA